MARVTAASRGNRKAEADQAEKAEAEVAGREFKFKSKFEFKLKEERAPLLRQAERSEVCQDRQAADTWRTPPNRLQLLLPPQPQEACLPIVCVLVQ